MFENQVYYSSTFNKDVNNLLIHPIINKALSSGGFIAGGLGRQIFNKESIEQYFVSGRGDIDIFFREPALYHGMRKWIMRSIERSSYRVESFQPSITGFCTDIYVLCSDLIRRGDANGHVKIQLVNMFHGDPEDVLSTFDLENCKVALTKNRMIYSSELPRLELLKTLKIVHSSSPLLAGRILKYRHLRKLNKYHPDGGQNISDWLLRWRFNKWDDHPFASEENSRMWKTQTREFLRRLVKCPDIVHDGHLSLLLGKLNYRVDVGSGYYERWETRCAIREEINLRNPCN